MKKSAKALTPAVLLCLALVFMLSNPGCVTEGAKSGLLLWYSSVVPALFPFMVLSGMIVASGGIRVLTAPFYFVLHPLLGLSRPGCYVFIAGLLCGYPMGAKTCADFLFEGRISAAEGRFLMAVCNHPSPMFLLGFVYPLICRNTPLCVFLAAVYGPLPLLAVLAKILIPFRGQKEEARDDGAAVSPVLTRQKSLDETILDAFEILCKIAGYLILFSIAISFLMRAKAIPALLRLFLIGIMEMATGIGALSALLPPPLSGAACCAALTFGGLSGLCQTKAVIKTGGTFLKTEKAGLSIRQYFLWKVLHGTCSFLLFLILAGA